MYTIGYGESCHTKLIKCIGLEKTDLLNHAYSTRFGGCSTGRFSSLNLGLHVGDDNSSVIENRRVFCKEMGIDLTSAVFAQQIHDKKTYIATSKDMGKGIYSLFDAIQETDCMCTNEKGVALAVMYADCTPVIILDPLTPAVGVAHAGWKGTALGAVTELIKTMQKSYKTNPEDCIASIGPCIDKCCYIVDERVYKMFELNGRKLDGVFEKIENDELHFRLNLKKSNQIQLLESGFKSENIFTYDKCTKCKSEIFFSSRASGGDTGRCAAIVMLK